MNLRIDTREQRPLDFTGLIEPVRIVQGTVPVFDYAWAGDEALFAVERKSLADFIESVVMQDRFRRELQKIKRARAAGMSRIYYVVEANFHDIIRFDYSRFTSGRVHCDLVFKRWRELDYFHDVHVVWAGDEVGAAHAVFLLLKSRLEDLKQQQTGEPAHD
ncbi:MAG: ERCC4 domain-containing protein [Kiritimatiellae bacterium]|nr:ERCC4 domain-containing protein [Kiritimatiellia bacterium]